MVARNFSLQDLPYSRLLQVDVPENEREFLTLDELKPHHLIELGTQQPVQHQPHQQLTDDFHQNLHLNHSTEHGFNVYYDLSSHPTNGQNNNLYTEGNSVSSEMTAGNFLNSSSGVSSCNMDTTSTNVDISQNHHQFQKGSRKRKFSYSEASDLDDDDKSVRTTDDSKKANHSEIEKRRRNKMNGDFITELSAMIPMCHAMSRKLDKLTVLRMAVQHLKTIRGAVHSYTEGHYKPAFLSDQELKMLILQAAEGFLFVVGCDRGRILYVSESVSEVLSYSQGDLLGQSWFDILHPKDVAKVKEQLSSSDLNPRERLIDAKTMLPVKHSDVPQGATRLCPGARRSFFCRMKCKNSIQIKEESDTNSTSSGCHRRNKKQIINKKFCVVQCTGYLKSWAPAKIGLEEQESEVEGDCNLSLSCLVAVGRLVDFNNKFLKPNGSKPSNGNNSNNSSTANKHNAVLRNVQFLSRHAMDGKFLFVDQRATLVLGFLPQELLGTSMYEYFNHKDIAALAESHKVALQTTEKVTTPVYGLRTKDNGFINVQSEWKSFKNPWTKDVEFLIAKNNVILSDLRTFESVNSCGTRISGDNCENNNYDFFNQSNGREIQRMINTHIEASKIGRQIAEQVLDFQRRMGDISSDSSPDPDPTLAQTVPLLDENHLINASLDLDHSSSGASPNTQSSNSQRINGTYANFSSYNHQRNNITLSPENGANEHAATTDGNDEAAMAVIMSLLEADAGLGGPVDFSGLPWPLP